MASLADRIGTSRDRYGSIPSSIRTPRKHIFYDCPGAQVGSEGRIVVLCNESIAAINFLRRRVHVTRIEPSSKFEDCVVIIYDHT